MLSGAVKAGIAGVSARLGTQLSVRAVMLGLRSMIDSLARTGSLAVQQNASVKKMWQSVSVERGKN